MATRRNSRSSNDRVLRQVGRELAREEAARERAEQKAADERYLRSRLDEAAGLTRQAEQARSELAGLLSRALAQSVTPLDLETLRPPSVDVPLVLGADAEPAPAPVWSSFAPAEPGVVGRMLGGRARYDRDVAQARARFDAATAAHVEAEAARRQRVSAARRRHAEHVDALRRAADERNAEVDRLIEEVPARDRHAVSDYYQRAIDSVRDPEPFPTSRRAAYLPESELLAIEWDLPRFSIVPAGGTYKYVKARDEIDHIKPASLAQRRLLYQQVVAQIALRAVRLAFDADPDHLVETVVFNGIMDDIDPATGQDVRRCLITLRATADQYAPLVLERVKPAECVRRHFAADISEHPDELKAVTPVLEFDMADPRVVDPIDILSELDHRPNLLELTGTEFERFVQNLFAKMGLQVQIFRPGGDGGVDCVVYDPHPVFGGKFCVQAKCYKDTVPFSAVRDLYGTMQHEGATKGLLITTSGFGRMSYAWANGKPLKLITGTELLGMCRDLDIPARILPTRSSNKRSASSRQDPRLAGPPSSPAPS